MNKSITTYVLVVLVTLAVFTPTYAETPEELIGQIVPNILVKGKQYEIHEIAGHKTVLNSGGKVITLDLVPGVSSSDIVEKIKALD